MKNNDFSDFEKFIKPKKLSPQKGTYVWSYTRVSTKDQSDNHSLDIQRIAAFEYAQKNGYEITKEFGGTYESASSDLSRKEFSRLINEVKSAKVKPFAILVYKANRFSRTGGSAIKLLLELIDVHKVHLIEVFTGMSSCSPRDELNFMKILLRAREENLDRLDVTIPAMTAFLEHGNWLGTVPRGYTHYGPRVKDISRIRGIQEMVINEEGQMLKVAWKLKLEGSSDVEIIKILDQNGMKKVSKQFLSAMWRKTFYCGININRLLTKPVKGNWEPLISTKDFMKVQALIEKNNHGYVTETINNDRPLVGTLYCPECNRKLTGYEVKKKAVHYYRCPKCNGVSINANTTSRAKGVGANNLFIEFLQAFSFPTKYIKLLEAQLKKLIDEKFTDKKDDMKNLRANLTELEKKDELLEKRFVFEEISKVQYDKYGGELKKQIFELKETIAANSFKLSNQDEKIKNSLILAQNISKIWDQGTYSLRTRLQKLIFPDGVFIDTKNRVYLTKTVNKFFELIANLSSNCEEKEKGLSENNPEKSLVVAGAGFEPTTFGL